MQNQTSNFNANWITRNNCFADGEFQGVKVRSDDIRNHYENTMFTARANLTGYWTPARVNNLNAEYAAASAKAILCNR